MKLFLFLVAAAVASAKPIRFNNTTLVPLSLDLGSAVLVVAPAGTTHETSWDFIGDGIADATSHTATVSGTGAVGVLASLAFTLNETESTLVVTASDSSGVYGVAVSEMRFRPARDRWSNTLLLSGFAAGFVLGVGMFIWRLSFETFQEAL